MNRHGKITGESLSNDGVYVVVSVYARRPQLKLSPHDARRTFAQLARQALAPLEQIQLSLGHASVETTERYLGTRLDLADAPSDRPEQGDLAELRLAGPFDVGGDLTAISIPAGRSGWRCRRARPTRADRPITGFARPRASSEGLRRAPLTPIGISARRRSLRRMRNPRWHSSSP
jgi:hypothetical protein